MKAKKFTFIDVERILLEFPYSRDMNNKIRQVQDSRYNPVLKAWHIPYTREAFKQLKSLVPDVEYDTKPKVKPGNTGKYENRTPGSERLVFNGKKIITVRDYPEDIVKQISLFRKWMEHKRYSPLTIGTYADAIKVFLSFVEPKKVDVEPGDMVRFVNEYIFLESGNDLRFIQELPGHKCSKTMEIYTHVSTKSLKNIKSPFDDL